MESPIWSTYCFLHFLQVMQYIRLLLWQVTLLLVVYSLLVWVLVILPDVSMRQQYLQLMCLHLFLCLLHGILSWPALICGNLALTKKSRKFFGRRWPKTNFVSASNFVTCDLFNRSQLSWIIGLSPENSGLKVVMICIFLSSHGALALRFCNKRSFLFWQQDLIRALEMIWSA